MDLLIGLCIIIVAAVMVRWWRRRENFINYYGFDRNILDKVCPSPWCGGGPVVREPEDAMYPFLVAGDDIKKMQEIGSEAHQVALMAGYDLEDDGLVNPSRNVKEILGDWEKSQQNGPEKVPQKSSERIAYGMAPKERFSDWGAMMEMPDNRIAPNDMYALYENNVLGDGRLTDGGDDLSSYPAGFSGYGSIGNGYTGGFSDDGGVFSDNFRDAMKYGAHREPPKKMAESFESQQNVDNYSYAARQVYEHPDMDNFNKVYYSNPSRTLGVAPQRQAVMHFNEGVGYYARPQELLDPSSQAVPDVNAGLGYGRAGELFDLPESFEGAIIEDPRKATEMPNGMYKGRRDINEVLDTEMRRRNQISLDAGQRGGRFSNKSRAIMSVVYSPEMFDATQNVWWEAYEA